jgi:hypothetical protein
MVHLVWIRSSGLEAEIPLDHFEPFEGGNGGPGDTGSLRSGEERGREQGRREREQEEAEGERRESGG